MIFYKKNLKKPKGLSEFVNRRADNTMAKRKTEKDKQRSTKHTHKATYRVTGNLLDTDDALRCYNKRFIYMQICLLII